MLFSNLDDKTSDLILPGVYLILSHNIADLTQPEMTILKAGSTYPRVLINRLLGLSLALLLPADILIKRLVRYIGYSFLFLCEFFNLFYPDCLLLLLSALDPKFGKYTT